MGQREDRTTRTTTRCNAVTARVSVRDRVNRLRRSPDLDCPRCAGFDADDKEIGTYPTMDEAAAALFAPAAGAMLRADPESC